MELNWLVYFVGSGLAFFIGCGLIVVAVCCRISYQLLKRFAISLFLLGGALLAISATPLPNVLWLGICLASIYWLFSNGIERQSHLSGVVLSGTIALVILIELPYHFTPSLSPKSSTTLLVLGDSVTAGTGAGDHSIKWPQRLVEAYGIQVDDRSIPGAKCRDAIQQLEQKPVNADIALLEIGGNDLMITTKSEDFAKDLDELLAKVSTVAETVVLFELPLPPLRNSYGKIQRALAKRYDVHLVPKRQFVSVITMSKATIDSVHLTQFGHDEMSELVWRMIGPAFERPK